MATLQRRLAAPDLKLTFDAYLNGASNTANVSIRQAFETLIFDASGNYANFVDYMDLSDSTKFPTGAAVLQTNHRIIAVASDGAVLFDSKATTNQSSNIGLINTSTGKPIIGDNHMTRPEIMIAALSQSGVGSTTRLSNTTKKTSHYLCYRVGQSIEDPKGFIRYSIEDAVAEA